jgi:hypothetical protein
MTDETEAKRRAFARFKQRVAELTGTTLDVNGDLDEDALTIEQARGATAVIQAEAAVYAAEQRADEKLVDQIVEVLDGMSEDERNEIRTVSHDRMTDFSNGDPDKAGWYVDCCRVANELVRARLEVDDEVMYDACDKLEDDDDPLSAWRFTALYLAQWVAGFFVTMDVETGEALMADIERRLEVKSMQLKARES